MDKPKVLLGHTSESNAYVVNDYPYGFSKRCRIRFWIETNNKGQRVCSQTTNPDRAVETWNKPKRSTYTDIRVLYIEPSNGHVENTGLGRHCTKKELDAFMSRFGEENFTDDYSVRTLGLMRKFAQLMMARYTPAGE